jgi:hypothetical protein
MKLLRTSISIFLAFAFTFSAMAQDAPEWVSLVQLIAAPEKYEGKVVMVTGFARLEFEGNAIYLHKDDYQYGLYKNGLWLDANECKSRNGKNFAEGYAMVIGRFTSNFRGHRDLWSGAIRDVESCKSWPAFPRGT